MPRHGHPKSARLAPNRPSAWMLALLGAAAGAQTPLPQPPTSPTPVFNYEYDAEGNPIRTVVAPATRAYATQHEYDSLSRRKKTTDAKSGTTQFGYDLQDQLTSVNDPRQLATQYQPTGLGNVKQLSSPDTGIATSNFDAAGNLLTRTDARGVLSTYSYDELNRPQQVVYSKTGSTSRTISWTYDQTGASYGYGVGRLTTAATPEASTTWRYDAMGRVTHTVQTATATVAGESLLIVSYGYDDAGHITQLTYPSGRVVNVTWANGQPQSISTTSGGGTQVLLDQITLSPFGPVKSWVWQLGGAPRAHDRVYDTNGRLVRHPLGTLVRDISYDDADRVDRYTHYTAATAQPAPAYDQWFSYDELNRLTAVTGAVNWSYAYDANGNRTAGSAGALARAYTVQTGSNRLDAVSNPARSILYDAAGNTNSDNQIGASSNFTASYSLEGRWATLSQGSTVSVEFLYDAGGRRVVRRQLRNVKVCDRSCTVQTGYLVTAYAYDAANHLIGEYNAAGNPITEYVWLGDTPVAVIKPDGAGAQIYAVHTDHLDTPRIILDAQGVVRWRWLGEPFGASLAEEQPTAGLIQVQQNLRFPGQQYESVGGRHYNHFRDYDPTTGRYVQSDPIGLAGGAASTYGYSNSSPTDTVDPFGLKGYKYGKNHPHCKAIKKKITNCDEQLDERWSELKGGLPERIGPGEDLAATMRGHRTLINQVDSARGHWTRRYYEECDDDDDSPGGLKTLAAVPAGAADAPGQSVYYEPTNRELLLTGAAVGAVAAGVACTALAPCVGAVGAAAGRLAIPVVVRTVQP